MVALPPLQGQYAEPTRGRAGATCTQRPPGRLHRLLSLLPRRPQRQLQPRRRPPCRPPDAPAEAAGGHRLPALRRQLCRHRTHRYCPQCGDSVSETSPAARIRRLLSNRYPRRSAGRRLRPAHRRHRPGGPGGWRRPRRVRTGGQRRRRSVSDGDDGRDPEHLGPDPRKCGSEHGPGGRERIEGCECIGERDSVRERDRGGLQDPRPLHPERRRGHEPAPDADPSRDTARSRRPFRPAPPGPLGALSWSGRGYLRDGAVLRSTPGRSRFRSTPGCSPWSSSGTRRAPRSGSPPRDRSPPTPRSRSRPRGRTGSRSGRSAPGHGPSRSLYVSSPTVAPTLAPVTVTSAVPIANVTTEVPTTIETVTAVTTEVTTTVPTAGPIQPRQSWEGGNGSFTVDHITLNEGPAVFERHLPRARVTSSSR